ncbi:hypothetical protein Natpe_3776 [Natrinema pellirubrum DSM 15624]|uniref:DUF5786 domain-containing protein n=3 Tax=Natrinema TaxID=88723 RepID=L0JSB7_NATP1|nr:hypothetical protein Natpe_3776 [Natrinema pellirubrum DSM 15624]
MYIPTMSMGAYDEDEHERREQQASKVDTDFDDERTIYHGEVEYDSGDSAEDLLDTFEQIKSE